MMMLSVEKKNRERHGREIKRSSKGNLLLIALQPRTFGCYQGGGSQSDILLLRNRVR